MGVRQKQAYHRQALYLVKGRLHRYTHTRMIQEGLKKDAGFQQSLDNLALLHDQNWP